MNKPLNTKVRLTIRKLRDIWARMEGKYPFVGFSTGKDSLAMAALLYEAVEPEKPVCIYAHHDLEYPGNLDYLQTLKERGFKVVVAKPFLEYFDLMDRGISFLTLTGAWCIPLLVGTTFLEWLQQAGARSPGEGVMFRGISRSEYSHKWHSTLELYRTLNIPCFNPMLEFTKEDIIELLRSRYGLQLNPIYEYMNRTYCICCYTSDERRQAYSQKHFPEECQKYYGQIEEMLFGTGLVNKVQQDDKYKTREEKIFRHGFIHWHRLKEQNVVGAVKRQLPSGSLVYRIKDAEWIDTKHLAPVAGKWIRRSNEIRFWDVPERTTDILIKRMINCLNCGFCIVQCFRCRIFDRSTKSLIIEKCIQCGRCLNLKFCMGWQHRFWRRVIVEDRNFAPRDDREKPEIVPRP
jgi:3'-phosphoadenosine 5'-phosphosulfate sulfotransferase (PAPS reductase)/FAD synthetase